MDQDKDSLQLLRLIELLNEDTRRLASDISKLNASQEVLKNDIASLLKIVRDGNGRESLVSLVARLDERMSQLIKSPASIKSQENSNDEAHKVKVQLALIAGVVSVLSIVLPLILSTESKNAPSLPQIPRPMISDPSTNYSTPSPSPNKPSSSATN